MSSHLVAIAAFDDVELLDLAGPLEVFTAADRLLSDNATGYRTMIVGHAQGPVRCAGGVSLLAEASWDDIDDDIDTLIVPGNFVLDQTSVGGRADASLVDWLATAGHRLPRIASVCTGAFTLAAAGLLDHRRATTHWAFVRQFAAQYPSITVDSDAIFVRQGRIWTSAGVSAGIDLALALVAADHNTELARRIARWLVLYLRRQGGQSQFSEFLAHSTATNAEIARLQAWIPDHLTENLSNEALAHHVGISVRHFARIFRTQVGTTPGRYVESMRIAAAARRLVHTDRGLHSIAKAVGFGSVETLHRVFKEHYGITPSAYREHFATIGSGNLDK